MTNRDTDQWRLPLRPPQHAAPVGLPVRRRARRVPARRGIWAAIPLTAGLCLAIAAVIVVAALSPHGTAHGKLGQGQKQVHLGASLPPGPTPSTSPVLSAHRRRLVFSGNGDLSTRQFIVVAHSELRLRWAYHCPERASAGLFDVEDAVGGRLTSIDGTIETTGAGGQGISLVSAAALPTRHYLVVTSSCSWRITAEAI